MKRRWFNLLCLLCLLPATACKKYLDRIPDSSLQVPRTVTDLRALLDNNLLTRNSTPGLGPLGTDDYYISYSTWQAVDVVPRNAYTWAADMYQGQSVAAWNDPYKAIYYTNVVLDYLDKVQVDDPEEYREVKGGALFQRAFLFYELEETFGEPYRPASAATDWGILLRLHSDLSAKLARSTVKGVFTQILGDLQQALPLLPKEPDPGHINRPSSAAAYALLARACLTMQDYGRSKGYADSCLALYTKLIDYNTLDTNAARPFSLPSNEEVLFQCSAQSYTAQYAPTTSIDTVLYDAYAGNDLRKALFFRTNAALGTKYFKGQYTGLFYLFSGLATDEVWLVRAECNARAGNKDAALQDLNGLLAMRWRTGTFIPYAGATADDALRLVLQERRKETLFRDLRWSDLRRLNQDPELALTLTRQLNGVVYTLPPGDPRYAYPIPDDEIRLNNVPQNPR